MRYLVESNEIAWHKSWFNYQAHPSLREGPYDIKINLTGFKVNDLDSFCYNEYFQHNCKTGIKIETYHYLDKTGKYINSMRKESLLTDKWVLLDKSEYEEEDKLKVENTFKDRLKLLEKLYKENNMPVCEHSPLGKAINSVMPANIDTPQLIMGGK